MLLGACTGGGAAPVQATPKGTVILESDRKPSGDIENTLMDGSQFSLHSQLGKVVFINFWGSWCAPCVAEAPLLESTYRQQQAAGVQFVGIVAKDDRDSAEAFVAAHGISYPNIFDYNAKSALQIGSIAVRGYPFSVAIDKHGRVAGVYYGPMLAGDINPVLAALIAEPGPAAQ